MLRINLLRLTTLIFFAVIPPVFGGNPCIDEYPDKAGEILSSPGGRVVLIDPVAWFEDGVFRITLESGGVIMTKPDGLPMPSIGSVLEQHIYSESKDVLPFAGCYCQVGTDICVEEYSYP